MTNNLPQIRAKLTTIEAFFAALPNPTIYAFIGDLANSEPDPFVAFFKAQHQEVWTALGPFGWKRQLSTKGDYFDFRKVVNGVTVELSQAQPNVAAPLFPSEVDPEFFARREAGITLAPNAVRDVTAILNN